MILDQFKLDGKVAIVTGYGETGISLKAAAKLLNLFLSGSLSYLNPASTFVNIPIKDIKPT